MILSNEHWLAAKRVWKELLVHSDMTFDILDILLMFRLVTTGSDILFNVLRPFSAKDNACVFYK